MSARRPWSWELGALRDSTLLLRRATKTPEELVDPTLGTAMMHTFLGSLVLCESQRIFIYVLIAIRIDKSKERVSLIDKVFGSLWDNDWVIHMQCFHSVLPARLFASSHRMTGAEDVH